MSNEVPSINQKISKKKVRKQIYAKLAGALAEYKSGLKEKRFKSNLKKASRLFAADIAKTIGKKKEKAENQLKEKTNVARQEQPVKEAS
jgi:hypothetical protein